MRCFCTTALQFRLFLKNRKNASPTVRKETRKELSLPPVRRALVMPDEKNSLTSTDTGANMSTGQMPVNLENSISARPSVQVPRVIQTENGCEITMVFRQTHDPKVRKEIAAMLLDAFRQRKDKDYEASVMPVQSINQGSGR